ncbi:BQ5605_C009g05695 [Microbotryum silenes-dioicae]|uniref:BQ5605_C009g05695 protein n=1 Tax=Microbotryum silenes-dioicae TaxID=796604 RepID=A0A2X0P9A3_9BASI|nr:BQ5605_C009g05695 [Microbotryum silenes-dioicae]
MSRSIASTSHLIYSPSRPFSNPSQPNSPALASSSSYPSRTQDTARERDSDDEEDDEEAWDEVDVMADTSVTALNTANAKNKEGLSIVIGKMDKKKGKGKAKADGSTTRERMVRQQRHKAHAACHLALGMIRNRQINDKLLQARLMSITPLHLQNAFFSFSKATHPNERDRIRLFDAALKDLLDWWDQYFEINDHAGVRRRPVTEVEDELKRWAMNTKKSVDEVAQTYPWEDLTSDDDIIIVEPPSNAKGQSKTSSSSFKKKKKKPAPKELARKWGAASEKTWEIVNGPHSLAKYALLRRGSRDVSAQLFTCLCRALDIPSRLIFSLQPVDWRAPSASVKRKVRGTVTDDAGTTDSEAGTISRRFKGKAKSQSRRSSAANSGTSGHEDDSGTDGWEDGQGRLTYKPPKVNLRRSKPAQRVQSGQALDDDPARPPVFWTEVWSRYTRQWITVDPIRRKMRCKSIMEPARSSVENQLAYVVAYEEDNTARDVTPRYAKSFNNYTTKVRSPSKRGSDWFAALIMLFERTYQLNRDREEQKELWDRIANEPFPTSVGGFKSHPNYVLEQHLHRDQVIRPGVKPLGLFKATEPVYPRSAVVELKSKENYWRMGRVVRDAEIPWKFVKSRTVTINRKRAEAVAQMDGGEAKQQPLYAPEQTKIYVPDPVVDGKVPKNDFGNIDLYVPSMLPDGAVHLTSKQAAKCAKTLGFDYAEAIVGFEFRQRRANPIINGVVVAQENADILIQVRLFQINEIDGQVLTMSVHSQAVMDSEEAADEKEFAKMQDRCLKRWKKLILGLRIRQRLQAAYHDKPVKVPAVKTIKNKPDEATKAPATKKTATRESSPPRKRVAIAKSTPTPRATRASKMMPAAAEDQPSSGSKHSSTGRTLQLTHSASKNPSQRTTRAQTANNGSLKSSPPAQAPVVTVATPTVDSGSESDVSSLEYESD